MWAIGALLIYLAIAKDMEPALLLPMGFGAILVNLPLSPVIGEHGIITSLFEVGGAVSEAMPLLLFIGIGLIILVVKLTGYCITKATEWKKSREEQNDKNKAS